MRKSHHQPPAEPPDPIAEYREWTEHQGFVVAFRHHVAFDDLLPFALASCLYLAMGAILLFARDNPKKPKKE